MSNASMDIATARAYDSELAPGLTQPWAESLLRSVELRRDFAVLDLACGTGIAARIAANNCPAANIIGTDIENAMLTVGATASKARHARVEYIQASASDLPFGSQRFDLVLCLQGLQYFPDRSKALREIKRVMQPRASFFSTTWCELESCAGYLAMVGALERRAIDASAARKPFSLSSEVELRELAESIGFRSISIHRQQMLARFSSAATFINAMLKGAPSSRYALQQVTAEQWPDFLSEVDGALRSWRCGNELAFPMESHILHAVS